MKCGFSSGSAVYQIPFWSLHRDIHHIKFKLCPNSTKLWSQKNTAESIVCRWQNRLRPMVMYVWSLTTERLVIRGSQMTSLIPLTIETSRSE